MSISWAQITFLGGRDRARRCCLGPWSLTGPRSRSPRTGRCRRCSRARFWNRARRCPRGPWRCCSWSSPRRVRRAASERRQQSFESSTYLQVPMYWFHLAHIVHGSVERKSYRLTSADVWSLIHVGSQQAPQPTKPSTHASADSAPERYHRILVGR